MEKEIINSTQDELLELWNDVYHEGRTGELYGETYKNIKTINTSEYSDGESWDYILERKSDGKFFKLHVWDAGDHNGYLIQSEYLEEVKAKKITDTIYE